MTEVFPFTEQLVLERGRARVVHCHKADSEEGVVLFNFHLVPATVESMRRLLGVVEHLTVEFASLALPHIWRRYCCASPRLESEHGEA